MWLDVGAMHPGSRRRPGKFGFRSWTLLSQKHRSGRGTILSLGRTFSLLPPVLGLPQRLRLLWVS